MNTAENIKKIALVFFIATGTAHLLSSLMVANKYFIPHSFVIGRVLDIPFAMVSVIYAFACLDSKIQQKNNKIINIAMVAICFIVFAGLMYISLFIPDKTAL